MRNLQIIRRPFRPFALAGLGLLMALNAPAAGTVTVCNEASLDAALTNGGTVAFACDGTITITSTKVISLDTVLDATGHTVAISGNNSVRLFTVNPAVNLSVYNLTLVNGRSTNGGAIYNSGTLVVSNSALSGNSVSNSASGLGGAIYNNNLATLIAVNSSFFNNGCRGGDGANNTAVNGTGFPGQVGAGGGIYNDAGNISVTNCTFAGNTSTGGRGGNGGDAFLILPAGNGGAGGAAAGGAISIGGGVLTVVNSTFVSNSCAGGNGGTNGNGGGGVRGNGGDASGGAIDHSGISANLINATFFGNGCTGGTGNTNGNRLGGNLRNGAASLMTLKNTIVAGSSAGTNASGAITDGGNNISSDLSCNLTNVGSLNNTDPRLGPLADNGGPTLTKALLQNSPAIDAGNSAVALPTDQRGSPRFGACDIGAFEMTPPTILSSVYLPNGHLRLQCSGVIGPSYFIHASTNLASWVQLTDLVPLTNRIFDIEDANASNFLIRFYRLQAH
ncbi:MAG: hypothetical protein HY298_04205 [Verrucomicrobia bacterium]|nr:hypothetical protein [Verrucomicrobiota bacterium]